MLDRYLKNLVLYITNNYNENKTKIKIISSFKSFNNVIAVCMK